MREQFEGGGWVCRRGYRRQNAGGGGVLRKKIEGVPARIRQNAGGGCEKNLRGGVCRRG